MAFLPDEDESIFQINVRGPQGTSLAATQSILDRIARDVRQELPGLRNTVVNVGGYGGGGGGNSGSVSVALLPVSERRQSQAELINRVRQMVKPYQNPDWRINVSASSSIAQGIGLGRGGSGIGYYISGPDMEKINGYANALVEKMKQDPLFRDPDNSIDLGTPEVRFVIDRTNPFEYQCVFSIPDQAMHSFLSPHNRVAWKLVAKVNAATWPVFLRSFPIIVYPAKSLAVESQPAQAADRVNV